MLAAERLDLVSVATPDDRHVGPVVAAAEVGAQGILCEKPLATALADADRLVAVAERTPVLVDHNGVRALVSASKGTPPGPRIDLIGTRRRIVVGERATEAWQSAEDEGELRPLPVTWAQGQSGADLGERLIPGVDHLIRMVRDGEPSSSPPRAARNVLEIILGACRSQAQGMVPVRLPLPRS
jgi:predicted dehydrogenase